MKLRIKSNSIRYRLTQSDVAALVKNRQLEDSVDFGVNKLLYTLQIVDDYQLSATFNNNTITLFIPAGMLTELVETDKVGFENIRHLPHLLVEKDFTCLDNVAEDQSDNYPNPSATKIL
ncbi:DUF7009 family protein [Mucilaginibacter flavidus]|uniref:DUF7009 family protein n=1 Tax=Mucilaginibacter flavidus TaxID=2949309 RepID=UPI0020934D9C|nr:hypothetical protein [Mucilaginibacter flavidus]MCO5947791.1 hypothetical protein [Mucilaginibacter flavidus]